MATWYYADNGQPCGPLSEEVFAQLVRDGRIQAQTLVWNETMPDWRPYGEVRAAAVESQAEALATGAEPGAPQAASPTPLRPMAAGAAAAGGAAGPAAATPAGAVRCAECGVLFPADEVVPISGQWFCAGCKPVALQRLREGAGLGAGMRYGGFWIRLVARLVDGIILVVVNILVAVWARFLLYALARSGSSGDVVEAEVAGALVGMLLQFVISIAYTVFFLGRFGATPGKMACGLVVVRSDGTRLTYGRALGRHFADILSAMTLCIGYLVAAFDGEKRALHDHICDTRVVHKR